MRCYLLSASVLALVLTACGPSKITVDTLEQSGEFEPTAVLAQKHQPSAKGFFYSRLIGDADESSKMWTGSKDIDTYLLVMDAGIETKVEDHAGYYRMSFYPRQLPQSFVDDWPEGIKATLRLRESGKRVSLYSKWPEDRIPDESGVITTDWAYCPDCTGKGSQNSETAKLFRSIAGTPSRATKLTTFEFVRSVPSGVTFGTEEQVAALAMKAAEVAAVKAAEREATEAEERRVKAEEEQLYGAARQDYAAFAADYKGSPLQAARNKKCGKLNLRSVPNYRDARSSDYERGMEQNVERFEKHVGCVTDFLEAADYESYASRAAEAFETEERLWAAANLPKKERVSILSVDEMVEKEQAYLDKSLKTFEGRAKDYERGWERHVEYKEKQARRTAERRRERKIEAEAKNCLMGLAARGAYYPGTSEGFCRNQAKKGLSGSQAAALGSSNPGSGGSSFPTYTQPSFEELGKFDLNAVIANARHAAETGNTSMLWDKSGRIRTTLAPEVTAPVPKSTSRNNTSRSKSRTSRSSSRSTSSTASASSAIERARNAAADASRNASAASDKTEVAAVQPTAEELAREAERQEAEERRAAERAEQERKREEARQAREAEKRRRDEIKALRASITPVTGGLQGCVEVVKERRAPGSSANSSCSYSEPDREALEITYLSRCSVPVNIEMNILYDTGENRDTGEYNIKPGRQRTTVGYCGAMNYSWRYEETSDSLSKRRDEAVRLSGLEDDN